MPNTLRLNAGAPANAPILAWLQIDDPAAAQTFRNHKSVLIERHQKYPVDTGHQKIDQEA